MASLNTTATTVNNATINNSTDSSLFDQGLDWLSDETGLSGETIEIIAAIIVLLLAFAILFSIYSCWATILKCCGCLALLAGGEYIAKHKGVGGDADSAYAVVQLYPPYIEDGDGGGTDTGDTPTNI
jgi:hypothetical protein